MNPRGHLKGRSVSISTYNDGCRCKGCREARRIDASTRPSHKVHSLARNRAAEWVRRNHPDQWGQLVADAYLELDAERRPSGRPRKAAS